MIRINQIKMPLMHTEEDVYRKAAKILRLERKQIIDLQWVKKSIDARKKPDIMIIYTVDVTVKDQEKVLRHCKNNQVQPVTEKPYTFPMTGTVPLNFRPVIIGTGPAGLFCGYQLAKHGFKPILLERGKPVEERARDVEKFWQEGVLAPDSNVQFGEGGAGTFSDGKLNTLIKDKYGRGKEVLRIFHQAGAPGQILYEAKPHIGTDILLSVVKNIREQIIEWGGEVRFGAKVTDLRIENNQIKAVCINDTEELKTEIVILAIGHSARDTFSMLYEKEIPMEAKSFAVGLRMEHPRKLINQLQYGMEDSDKLPTASYKVTTQTASGRGVYSFCMCPGGYVVNASSEPGRTAVNGMSYSGRNGKNSNSAMIVTITPQDYGSNHPLAGIAFQRKLEETAYRIGKGAVPVETYGAYKKALTGQEESDSIIQQKYPDFRPAIKGAYCMAPVHEILPNNLGKALVEGIDQIGHTLPGFADSGAFLSGVESRTSSPVRIARDESGQSVIRGLYPCGEGAGYAGGITSAAMDGILVAEKIAAYGYPGKQEKYDNANP